jgi:hypothetical protein
LNTNEDAPYSTSSLPENPLLAIFLGLSLLHCRLLRRLQSVRRSYTIKPDHFASFESPNSSGVSGDALIVERNNCTLGANWVCIPWISFSNRFHFGSIMQIVATEDYRSDFGNSV